MSQRCLLGPQGRKHKNIKTFELRMCIQIHMSQKYTWKMFFFGYIQNPKDIFLFFNKKAPEKSQKYLGDKIRSQLLQAQRIVSVLLFLPWFCSRTVCEIQPPLLGFVLIPCFAVLKQFKNIMGAIYINVKRCDIWSQISNISPGHMVWGIWYILKSIITVSSYNNIKWWPNDWTFLHIKICG